MTLFIRALCALTLITMLAPHGAIAGDLRPQEKAPIMFLAGVGLPVLGGMGCTLLARGKEHSINIIIGLTLVTTTIASCISLHKEINRR